MESPFFAGILRLFVVMTFLCSCEPKDQRSPRPDEVMRIPSYRFSEFTVVPISHLESNVLIADFVIGSHSEDPMVEDRERWLGPPMGSVDP